MAEVTLEAATREGTGKGVARRSRAAGKVPGVLYGRGIDPVALEVDRRELLTAFHTEAGMNVLIELKIDGDQTLAMARELQRDPVRGTVIHADFLRVDRTQQIEVDIPLNLVGESPGVKEGGVLEQPTFRLNIRCVVTDVPEFAEADISGLDIGDSLRVAELLQSVNYEILNDPNNVVASVAAPISEEELEAMVAEAAEGPEGEVPEGEVPEGELAEGEEAPAEGADAPAGEAAEEKPEGE